MGGWTRRGRGRGVHVMGNGHDVHTENSGDKGQDGGQKSRTPKEADWRRVCGHDGPSLLGAGIPLKNTGPDGLFLGAAYPAGPVPLVNPALAAVHDQAAV